MRLKPLLSGYLKKDVFQHPVFKRHLSIFSSPVLLSSFSLFLSLVLLVNAIGYYPLFKIKQWQVHEEMKTLIRTSLPAEQLRCITITVNEQYKIHWEWEWEEEQEFMYEGNRYDVVRTSISGNTTYYYCIQDTQETQLLAQLEKEADRKMDDKSNPLRQTAKKMLKLFSSLIHQPYDNGQTKDQLLSKHYFDKYDCLYHYDFSKRITPPPQQLA